MIVMCMCDTLVITTIYMDNEKENGVQIDRMIFFFFVNSIGVLTFVNRKWIKRLLLALITRVYQINVRCL